ncbi:hypothetical protein JL720_15844 [Aureococcus anophagefferens]|nr:hypothetical protein JL720_15844 [Aureococcus anophagefferens]
MTDALDAWYDSLARCAGCVCVADEDAEDPPDPRTPEFTVLRREAATVAPTLSMLLEAADAGDIATVRAIVGAGGLDLDAADDVDSYSALLTAARRATPTSSARLDAGASVDAPRDSYGRTPLCAAAVAGRADVVERLVAAGADVDAADGDGRSVLWATCALRHLDVAAILARGACDVDAADADGDTALDFAVKHGHADNAELHEVLSAVHGPRCGGFFIESGANNGRNSVTRNFEGAGWRGICVEPSPVLFQLLQRYRPLCENHNVALFGERREMVYRERGAAFSRSGAHAFQRASPQGAELSILEHFPFDKIVVELWFVETNKLDRVAFVAFMESKGYSCHHYDHVNSLCQLNKHRRPPRHAPA